MARTRHPSWRLMALPLLLAGIEACAPEGGSERRAVTYPDPVRIAALYAASDTVAYTDAVRYANAVVHRLRPAECIVGYRRLLDHAAAKGLDGLESVMLAYHDCAAAEPAQARALAAVLERLHGIAIFRDAPLPNLYIPYSAWNSVRERTVRQDALRVPVAALAALDPHVAATAVIAELSEVSTVNAALCALPARENARGVALPDLIRKSACAEVGRAGGAGTVEDMCRRLAEGADGSPGSAGALSAEERARLEELCNSRAGGTGLTSLGTDPFDPLSLTDCMETAPADISVSVALVAALDACAGTGDNPFASDDNSKLGTYVGWDYIYGGTDEHGEAEIIGVWERTEKAIYIVYIDGEEIKTSADAIAEVTEQIAEAEGDDENEGEGDDGDGAAGEDDGAAGEGDDGEGDDGDADGGDTPDDGNGEDADGGDAGGDEGGFGGEAPPEDGAGTPTTPGAEGGTDAECQQALAAAGITTDAARHFFDEVWGRNDEFVDPRVVNPDPGSADPNAEGPACGVTDPALTAGARCHSLVLCAEGQFPDENCQCSALTSPHALALTGCYNARCPDGAQAQPAGAGQCQCVSDETGAPVPVVPPPEPGPVPVDSREMPGPP